MTTPRAAQHRDLEQRIKDLEAQVRTLTSRVLYRERLNVSAGDLVVSGGGGVDVRDGGRLTVRYPNGQSAVYAGDIVNDAGGYEGTGLLVERTDGQDIAVFRTDENQDVVAFVADGTGTAVLQVDKAGGLARPNMHYPLTKAGTEQFTTGSDAWVDAFTGGAAMWSPNLYVRVLALAGNGNTGYVRTLVDGIVTGVAQFFDTTTYLIFNDPVANFIPGQTRNVQVQLRRSAGTGTVACQVYECRGGASLVTE